MSWRTLANWLNIRDMHGYQYPYDDAQEIPRSFEDAYDRPGSWLVASLACFGNMCQVTDGMLTDEEVERDIPTLTRSCIGALTPMDLEILLQHYPPAKNESRMVLALSRPADDLCNALENVHLLDQVIFYLHLPPNKWVIFLAQIPNRRVEAYFVGCVNLDLVYSYTHKIYGIFGRVSSGIGFYFVHRLQVPVAFGVDPVLMAYIMIHCLHRNDKYLDLTAETIINQQCSLVLAPLVQHHDQWLGKLHTTKSTHPFVTTANHTNDNLQVLEDLGWNVIDVTGDGNCGFYCLILGLENNGYYDCSVPPNSKGNLRFIPMRRNANWQRKVVELREQLRQRSRFLLATEYPVGTRTQQWWAYSTAVGDDEIDQLSEKFLCDDFKRHDYFSDEFRTQIEFHMNPYWTAYVFSTLFQMRVIVYTRATAYNKNEEKPENRVSYTWSTTTCAFDASIDERIVQEKGIKRLTDLEFKERPTVELLFLTGYVNTAQLDNQHFQFLRRVICNGVTRPPPPSQESLREVMQRIPPSDRIPNLDVRDILQENQPPQHIPVHKQVANSVNDHRREGPSKGKKPIGKKVVKRSTPSKTKRNIILHASKRGTRNELRELTIQFNKEYEEETAPTKIPTQMQYDPISRTYWTRNKGENGLIIRQRVIWNNLGDYPRKLVDSAMTFAGQWVGPSLGAPGDREPPPPNLSTGIVTIYQQHNRPYCLTYSLASALFYCGFDKPAQWLSEQAIFFSAMHLEQAITETRAFMQNLVPVIGIPTLYGIRTKSHSRTKRELKWDDLYASITPYPTVVVPVLPDGRTTHAVCIVDDLIFDSMYQHALKLHPDSVKWLFEDSEPAIYQALRFQTKFSEPGNKLDAYYRRTVEYNWTRGDLMTYPSIELSKRTTSKT